VCCLIGRLHDWDDFNHHYRDLCEWLTGVEKEVSQTGDGQVEETLGKMQKVNFQALCLYILQFYTIQSMLIILVFETRFIVDKAL